jgi:hypothetical protein
MPQPHSTMNLPRPFMVADTSSNHSNQYHHEHGSNWNLSHPHSTMNLPRPFMVANISTDSSSQFHPHLGHGSFRETPHPHSYRNLLRPQGSNLNLPRPSYTVDLNMHNMELDRNSPGPDYTQMISSSRRAVEFARNLPRPSPYRREDHPHRYTSYMPHYGPGLPRM